MCMDIEINGIGKKTYYGMDQNKSDISDSTVYVHVYDNFVRFRRPDKV